MFFIASSTASGLFSSDWWFSTARQAEFLHDSSIKTEFPHVFTAFFHIFPHPKCGYRQFFPGRKFCLFDLWPGPGKIMKPAEECMQGGELFDRYWAFLWIGDMVGMIDIDYIIDNHINRKSNRYWRYGYLPYFYGLEIYGYHMLQVLVYQHIIGYRNGYHNINIQSMVIILLLDVITWGWVKTQGTPSVHIKI